MNDELLDRQQAIVLRLAGRSVRDICRRVGHSREWFHRCWRRYRALGPDGLWEQPRTAPLARRIAADLERTILMVRERIDSRTHPGTRYSLIGAQAL